MKRIVKIFLLAVLALAALLLLFIFIRFCQYSYDTEQPPDTEISHYLTCRKDHWAADDPVSLFPEASVVEQSTEASYLHKHERSPTFLFDDDIVTALHCIYTEQDYQREAERLGEICSPEKDLQGNTVFVLTHGIVTAYARLVPETQEIWYIAYQEHVLIKNWPELELKQQPLP